MLTCVLVVAFFGLCAWQVDRALSGNTLSWAYVFEWPLFAGYLVYMRVRLGRDGADRPPRAEDDERESAELEAYNRYLADLADDDRRRS